jgi:hypothetical protein
MIDDWPSEIVVAVIVRQHLAAVDDLYEYPLPEVAASEDLLVTYERSNGALDPRYREFLTFANGWPNLLQEIDLFGTEQLLGAAPMESVEEGIAAVGDVSEHIGYHLADMQPIGGSASQTDIWLIGRPGYPGAGRVLWFWGSDYEDFENFDEFYLAMVDHNRLTLQRRTSSSE